MLYIEISNGRSISSGSVGTPTLRCCCRVEHGILCYAKRLGRYASTLTGPGRCGVVDVIVPILVVPIVVAALFFFLVVVVVVMVVGAMHLLERRGQASRRDLPTQTHRSLSLFYNCSGDILALVARDHNREWLHRQPGFTAATARESTSTTFVQSIFSCDLSCLKSWAA